MKNQLLARHSYATSSFFYMASKSSRSNAFIESKVFFHEHAFCRYQPWQFFFIDAGVINFQA